MRRWATLAAVSVALTLIILKAGAWWASGSVAVLGSLLDSMLDFIASAVTFVAVRFAMNPPDREHRFGHGKAEALAGMARGLLVLGSGFFVGWEAVRRLLAPEPVRHEEAALAVMAFSAVLSFGLAFYQYRVYRRTRSVAIGADAANYGADVLVSIGAIGAVWMAGDARFAIADPLFGFAMAIIIAFSAWGIVARSYDQLMDRELNDRHRQHIKGLVMAHPCALGVHDLRTRRSGADLFIQFHLELDPGITLREAHQVADEVESLVRSDYPDAEVIVHQEPVGEFIENELVKT